MTKQRNFRFTMPMPLQYNPNVMAGELEIEGVYYALDDYDIDHISCNGCDLTDIIMNTNIFDPVFEQINDAAAQHIEWIYQDKFDNSLTEA